MFQTKLVSSLYKVFADEPPAEAPHLRGSALQNESYSFQIAYSSEKLIKPLRVRVNSDLAGRLKLYAVGLAPSELPWVHNKDENYLRTAPGLYPDPLYPLEEQDGAYLANALPGQWRAIWVNVQLDEGVSAGTYGIELHLETEEGEALGSERFELEVIPALLPEQKLIHTEWFHTDCLATHYQVDVFSERYWEIVENYARIAVEHGINTLLTPIFTPPLDTAVGGERPTVQLVDVVKTGSTYSFGFDKLRRWVDMCNAIGVKHFEFSHLFTQWGAMHAPKIVAEVDGEMRKIFGWETDAAGEEYRDFLNQFLPELKKFIKEHGLEQRVFFHVSDEPRLEHLEQYRKVSGMLREHLDEFPIIDALSNYEFYEQGVVKHPIPANNHIDPFLENGVKPLWTYYCVSQQVDVSNRFFAMPSARNRVIGTQLYKFDIDGFLHWGYNFWYKQYSLGAVNPFVNTDAGNAFPSGDPFLVYPGEDGKPILSIRMKVFYEALQDLRAFQLLESFIGKEAVVALIEEGLEQPLTFKQYPHDAAWLLGLRERVNQLIKEHRQ